MYIPIIYSAPSQATRHELERTWGRGHMSSHLFVFGHHLSTEFSFVFALIIPPATYYIMQNISDIFVVIFILDHSPGAFLTKYPSRAVEE